MSYIIAFVKHKNFVELNLTASPPPPKALPSWSNHGASWQPRGLRHLQSLSQFVSWILLVCNDYGLIRVLSVVFILRYCILMCTQNVDAFGVDDVATLEVRSPTE